MTPGQKKAELYEQAWSATKMADKFLGSSNCGREQIHVRQAKSTPGWRLQPSTSNPSMPECRNP